jgi:hypothetical protein
VGAPFDTEWAERVIEQLRNRGVKVAASLDDADIAEISEAFRVPMPQELALFLRAGLPVSPRWTDWRRGAATIHQETEAWLHRAFAFDIEHSNYWHPLLGVRPDQLDEAIAQAIAALRTMPPVFPIYAHRFLTTAGEQRAVLSIWQAVDSIIYGNDFADYLAREFELPRPTWTSTGNPAVPKWEQLFDLYGTEGTDLV